MGARTRTIKVSEREWQMLQSARDELARHGYEDLEPNVRDAVEKKELGRFLQGLALGAIAAVGAAAVISLLRKQRD